MLDVFSDTWIKPPTCALSSLILDAGLNMQ